MTLVYRSICMEIDELTIKIMHLSEKLVNYKLEVEKIMNSGFVNIAKARYIMGTKCVSTLQLPTINSNPIQPLVTVSRSYDTHWMFKAIRRKPSPLTSDEKLIKEKMKTDTTRADVMKKLLEQDSKNIRKRKEFYLVEDGNYKELNDELQDEVSTDISSESTESLVNFTDPIRLFGVLVPYTLRVAQKNFQEVVDILLICATVQSETHTVLKRYYHLMKVKRMIEKAAEERNVDLTEEKEYWTPSEKSDESYEVITEVPSDHSIPKESEVDTDDELVRTEPEIEKSVILDEDLEIPGEEQIIFPVGSAEYVSDEYGGEFESETAKNSDKSSQK